MCDDSDFQEKMEDSDFENMKVIELKKRLKSHGLSVTGNKSELVERLQDAINSEKGVESVPDVDSTLVNDSSETNALNTSENSLVEEFSLSSAEKDMSKEEPMKSVDSTTNSNPASIPLKKRAVAQAAAINIKVEKKMVLKRNNIPTPQIIASKPAVPLKTINIITMDKIEHSENGKQDEEIKSESTKNGNVIRLSSAPAKSLSEFEKINLRAKRFETASPTDKPKIKVSTSSVTAAVASNVSSISLSRDISSLDVMKKRAERFGQNVSTVMKKMEDQQNILKRKNKFGDSGTGNDISPDDQEKKKKRAERFGI